MHSIDVALFCDECKGMNGTPFTAFGGLLATLFFPANEGPIT
jgi:hypothetical protein